MRTIAILLFSLLFAGVPLAGTLETVQFTADPNSKSQTVIISGTGLSAPSVFEMTEGGHRIVADFASDQSALNVEPWDKGQSRLIGQGDIVQIRQAVRGKQGVRLVLDLRQGASLQSSAFSSGALKITVNAPGIVQTRMVQTKPRYFKRKIPYPILKPAMLFKARTPPIIVIDPGHGGRDPGAVGQGGTYEKSVTLAAAKELKALLEKSGRYEVVLTRGGDSYVEHEDRIKIARKKNADLFISIHADSTASSKTRGASVYTLADRAAGRSKRIVNSQNWIMDVDLSTQTDPVGDILVDLAQRKTFSQSANFADELLEELSGSTKLVRNSHRRAGYYVLLAPDVPAVLLELGFISNRQDEKLLKSRKHRTKVLKSVRTAIDDYFANQNP